MGERRGETVAEVFSEVSALLSCHSKYPRTLLFRICAVRGMYWGDEHVDSKMLVEACV